MGNTSGWQDAVRVVRGAALTEAMQVPAAKGRATAFDFTGAGGRETWIGTVIQQPGSSTGVHHHGPHEVAIYVVRGRSEIRWGERLEFAAEVGPGDLVYFAPFVPHQERTLSADEPVRFIVVRSDNKGHVTKLDVVAEPSPQFMY